MTGASLAAGDSTVMGGAGVAGIWAGVSAGVAAGLGTEAAVAGAATGVGSAAGVSGASRVALAGAGVSCVVGLGGTAGAGAPHLINTHHTTPTASSNAAMTST